MKKIPYKAMPQQQQGVVLVISLIFLFMLTMLSLSSMQSSGLETKIAINNQFKQISYEAAESALARLTSEKPEVDVPLTEVSSAVTNTAYFSATGVDNQPDTSADVKMDLLEISPPGKYKFSGFGLDVVTLRYQADSLGHVGASRARAHHRMEVALIRD